MFFDFFYNIFKKEPKEITASGSKKMTMDIGDRGLQLIKHFEGCYLTAYQDVVGVWTIGIGCTEGVKPGQVITEQEALDMLASELVQFVHGINTMVKVPLEQHQFDALVAFTYNVGLGNFKSSTLLRLLNQGNYDAVPEQLMRWNKAGGKVFAGLTRRRRAEGILFSTGELDFGL